MEDPDGFERAEAARQKRLEALRSDGSEPSKADVNNVEARIDVLWEAGRFIEPPPPFGEVVEGVTLRMAIDARTARNDAYDTHKKSDKIIKLLVEIKYMLQIIIACIAVIIGGLFGSQISWDW